MAAQESAYRSTVAHHPTPEKRDERIALPLDPETALRALLAVKPDDEVLAIKDEAPTE